MGKKMEIASQRHKKRGQLLQHSPPGGEMGTEDYSG